MKKTLTLKYFADKNTVQTAKNLLGKFLARRYKSKTKTYLITEVEAYDGFRDKASHAHKGMTERNKIMFGPAGYWYVYLTYGMHWMLNIVTGPAHYPAAILISGIRVYPFTPLDRPRRVLSSNGASPRLSASILNGPAKLTKALHINKNLNSQPANKKSGLWIADGGLKIKPNQIKSAPRIGVDYAGPVWSKKKWRFYLNK